MPLRYLHSGLPWLVLLNDSLFTDESVKKLKLAVHEKECVYFQAVEQVWPSVCSEKALKTIEREPLNHTHTDDHATPKQTFLHSQTADSTSCCYLGFCVKVLVWSAFGAVLSSFLPTLVHASRLFLDESKSNTITTLQFQFMVIWL